MTKPIVLVGDTGSSYLKRRIKEEGFGVMFVDRLPKIHYEGMPWAWDNGCFGAWRNETEWNAGRWHIKSVQIRTLAIHTPLFAVVPDLPARGRESLEFSRRHLEMVPHGFPKALVIQDGMTFQDVKAEAHLYDYFFLGGTDALKVQAKDWCRFVHDELGKPFHYGRASTLEKLEWAIHCGVDSLDSSFPVVDETKIQHVCRHFCERTSQLCPVSKVSK